MIIEDVNELPAALMEGIMGRLKFSAGIAMLILTCGFWVVSSAIQGQTGRNQAQPGDVHVAKEKAGLTNDQARMIVKEIPAVDIKATLSRWKLREPELAKLRQWSGFLAQDPGRKDFLPQWSEFISQIRAKNPNLQGSDVTSLIQMLMLAAYEEASQNLDSHDRKIKFYTDLQESARTHLTEGRQLQVLVGRQRNDPLAGSLIRLPAYQRTLQKCQVQSEPNLKLECKEVLVSTSMELENYLAESEEQIKKAEEDVRKARLDLENMQQKRLQKLEMLSDNSKAMYDTAMAAIRKSGS